MTRTRIRTRRSSLVAATVVLLLGLLTFAPAASAATVTVDLYARSNRVNLINPGGNPNVDIWGYVTDPTATVLPDKPGGPVIRATAGDTVVINLTNQLYRNAVTQAQPVAQTGLWIPGLPAIPDLSVVSHGATNTYTFTAPDPGTYLYEAPALLDGGFGNQYQSAMGLHGVLVVDPVGGPGQAYGASSAYDVEQVMILSEMDRTLNNAGNPANFDMRDYDPDLFLINGEIRNRFHANNDITVDGTLPDQTVLVRYANAGGDYHSMSTLGVRQQVIAYGGDPLTYPHTVVAETFGPGQTADVLIDIPDAADGQTFMIYDANMMLRTINRARAEGMMAFINVSGTPMGGDGPVVSNIGFVPGTLTADVTDAATGGDTIAGAEYFVGAVGAPGTGTPMNALDGAFDEVAENLVVPLTLSGTQTVYVRGQDSLGNWGSPLSLTINVNDDGLPVTSAVTLDPNPWDGTGVVTVDATGDDSATGGSGIASGEAYINGDTGTIFPLTSNNPTASVAALTGTIPAAAFTAGPGDYTISVRSIDSAGNVGLPEDVTLTLEPSAPVVSNLAANPNPNNGAQPFSSTVQAVRVFANVDVAGGATVQGAEAFLDTVGADGTGIVMLPADGLADEAAEYMYADIPLSTINLLTEGDHTIYVHGQSSTGVWGDANTTSTVITIDKTAPTVTSITRADPDPSAPGTVRFDVTFDGVVEGVTAANFSLVEGVGMSGSGITAVAGVLATPLPPSPMQPLRSIPDIGSTWEVTVVTGGAGGTLGLDLTSVTDIADLAGNALPAAEAPTAGEVYTISPMQFTTQGNNNATPDGVAAPGDNADIYEFGVPGVFSRLIDGQNDLGLPGGANVDAIHWESPTEVYVSFQNTYLGFRDEDVALWNGATLSMFFDGSANGITQGSSDIDAISVVGGDLYYSLNNNFNPAGGGGGNRASIYRWDGATTTVAVAYNSIGIPGGAQLNGLTYVNGTDLYLTFGNNSGVALPTIGTVQDEDVVHFDAGSWTMYWDGSTKGNDANNGQDLDGIDVP